MAYTLTTTWILPATYTGWTVRARTLTYAGVWGDEVSTIIEVSPGVYACELSLADGFRGWAVLYRSGDDYTTLANRLLAVGIDPREAEYCDVATSTRATPTDVANAVSLIEAYGDGAWKTATGFSTLGESDIRTALGMDLANLDEQLADILAASGSGGLTEAQAATLAAIAAKAALIGSSALSYLSPSRACGSFLVYAGTDYLAEDGRALSLTVTDYGGPDLENAEAYLRVLGTSEFDGATTTCVLEAEATVAVDGTTVVVSADIAGTDLAALETYPPNDDRNYVFQFVATTEGGSILVLGEGFMTVKKLLGTLVEES